MKRKHARPLREDAGIKYREVPFRVKSVEDSGRFSGYASVFGVIDSYKEIVMPGAFVKCLEEWKATGDPMPALWQHRSAEPIGGYDLLAEDEKGLFVEGFLLKDEIVRAQEAHALMKAKIVTGLSIGYYVRKADSWDEVDNVRRLRELKLVEVSPVTFPANEEARIDTVKAKLAHGALPSLREFEALLREQGFSRSNTVTIAKHGYSSLLALRESGDAGTQAALETLRGFTIPTFSGAISHVGEKVTPGV